MAIISVIEQNVAFKLLLKTNHEIDRKLYELYGLTEEEIKIVEGL